MTKRPQITILPDLAMAGCYSSMRMRYSGGMEPAPAPTPSLQKRRNAVAAFAYLVFFAPLLTAAKYDSFVLYHVKQSIGLVITGLAAQGIISILGYWGVGFGIILILVWILRIFLAAQAALGIVNAWQGEMKPLPLIGLYSSRL